MSTPLPQSLQQGLDATEVNYVQVGASGLRVSVPILGTMGFGHKDWKPWVLDDEEQVEAILKVAYDRGLTTWDTANVYSNGISEKMIGQTIAKFKIPRHKLILLTKICGIVGEQPNVSGYPEMKSSRDYVNQGGLSRTAIFNAVNASLKRLQTTYIDLLQIHRYDATVPVAETMKALHDLVQCGKVRYIGASSMWTYQFARMQFCAEKNSWTQFISMQNHYSLCYREEEREMNRFCAETGVGLIPWAPLYDGELARPLSHKLTERAIYDRQRKGITESDREIVRRVEDLAKKKNWTMAQVALEWIIQKGAVPIVGISSLARLDEACSLKGKTLTDDEMTYLEDPYVAKKIVGHS